MGDVLARLCVLVSFLEGAATAPKLYIRPVLHYEGEDMMMLDHVCHPCVEVLDGMSFIANIVYLKQGKTVCECL